MYGRVFTASPPLHLVALVELIWDPCRFVTFICGRAGICALGAVVAKHAGDEASVARYLNSFKQVTGCDGMNADCELRHWIL